MSWDWSWISYIAGLVTMPAIVVILVVIEDYWIAPWHGR